MIELLIVVAIIGILAAIAIPNFLEAQIRAKTARVKAEIRSLALAMETYYLDNNDYPMWYGGPTPGWHFERLTTPVSHLSSVPFDIFSAGRNPGATGVTNEPYDYFLERDISTGTLVYLPGGTARLEGKLNNNESIEFAFLFDKYKSSYPNGDSNGFSGVAMWAISSFGPDAVYEGWSDGGFRYLYDPTNGTVSKGDIIRVGP